METNKIIAQNYQIIKPLFQINSYLYVQRTPSITKFALLKPMKSSMLLSYIYEYEVCIWKRRSFAITKNANIETRFKDSTQIVELPGISFQTYQGRI